MVESERHAKMRKELERKLENKGLDFISSHSPDAEGQGPALYLGDPRKGDRSKSEYRISQPDILIKSEDGSVDIIEIEADDKTPKYLLGDLYSVLHSEYFADEGGRVRAIDELRKIYILIAQNKVKDQPKPLQYVHLVESFEKNDEFDIDFDIFWKEDVDKLIDKFTTSGSD